MFSLFHKLPQNIIRCFRGYYLFWQIVAIILTFILVNTGFDWLYFTHTRSALLFPIIFPAILLGGVLPILAPVILLIYGTIRRNKKMILTAYVIGQAAIIGALISAFYKALTGRIPPEFMGTKLQNLVDLSNQFQFGFLRGGIFWGWPSTHTTIAFAMAVAFVVVYARIKKLRYVSVLVLIYALYVGLSVSVSIHWFSEFIAGAIMGSVIGIVVGKSFKTSPDLRA